MQHLRSVTSTGETSAEANTSLVPHVPFDQGAVRVVSSYEYLGRWSALTTSQHQDIQVRRARAINAFNQNEKVLKSC
eukprot:1983178-Amphidinium_carterae.1